MQEEGEEEERSLPPTPIPSPGIDMVIARMRDDDDANDSDSPEETLRGQETWDTPEGSPTELADGGGEGSAFSTCPEADRTTFNRGWVNEAGEASMCMMSNCDTDSRCSSLVGVMMSS